MDTLEKISNQLMWLKVMLGISLFFQAFSFFSKALENRWCSRYTIALQDLYD